jgi:hypothetical protein
MPAKVLVLGIPEAMRRRVSKVERASQFEDGGACKTMYMVTPTKFNGGF